MYSFKRAIEIFKDPSLNTEYALATSLSRIVRKHYNPLIDYAGRFSMASNLAINFMERAKHDRDNKRVQSVVNSIDTVINDIKENIKKQS